jgi:hypothetical protein
MAMEIGPALLLLACCVVVLEQFLLIFPHDPMQKLTFKPVEIRGVTCSLLEFVHHDHPNFAMSVSQHKMMRTPVVSGLPRLLKHYSRIQKYFSMGRLS